MRTMNQNTAVAISTVLAFAATAVPAFAQAGDRDSAVAKPLLACRQIDDGGDRLACFDRAMDTLYGVDEALAERRAEQKQARFGLPVDDKGMQLTELEAVVTEVDENLRFGRVLIALDNGQVWQLLSSGGLRARLKPGMQVVISESGTGGYRVRVPEKTGFKGVIRVR